MKPILIILTTILFCLTLIGLAWWNHVIDINRPDPAQRVVRAEAVSARQIADAAVDMLPDVIPEPQPLIRDIPAPPRSDTIDRIVAADMQRRGM